MLAVAVGVGILVGLSLQRTDDLSRRALLPGGSQGGAE